MMTKEQMVTEIRELMKAGVIVQPSDNIIISDPGNTNTIKDYVFKSASDNVVMLLHWTDSPKRIIKKIKRAKKLLHEVENLRIDKYIYDEINFQNAPGFGKELTELYA